ncbi:MAG: hypothetical protein JOZ24_13020 [Candidatus Eremiobacteraeota bacterium]|nr:hypothetical protein [Candidatus Eremiobacteraeota bacterium]
MGGKSLALQVLAFPDDAAGALVRAEPLLRRQPVRHTLLLTLLTVRAAQPQPGRYWVALRGGRAVGVAFHSPLEYRAVISPMMRPAVHAVAEAMWDSGAALPGVSGEPHTAVQFAAKWAQLAKASPAPTRALQLYEARRVREARKPSGRYRAARRSDRATLIEWVTALRAETREPEIDAAAYVDRALAAGQLSVWDDHGAATMAATSAPVAGVVRVIGVYTPTARRARGYAGACVAQLTRDVLAAQQRCVLYADVADPVATGVYRRIGYVAVSELLTLMFS